MVVLAEFEVIFLQIISKKVGHDDRIIIMLYKVINTFSGRHKLNFERPKIDGFWSEISENGNVNISVKIKMHDIGQVILLSCNHKRVDQALGKLSTNRKFNLKSLLLAIFLQIC